jgi:chromosome segregation ATPase
MKTDKKIALFLIPSMLIFIMSSCSIYRERPDAIVLSDFEQGRDMDLLERRFKEPDPQERTTVEPAIELSKRYAELSEETAALKLQSGDLIAENDQLKGHIDALEAELLKTQEELAQANNLLRDMVIELNNWKTNVIGFRDEMRGAEKAQLEALLKILKVLGGEVKAESAEEGAGSAVVSAVERGPSELRKTPTAGELDE